MRAMSTETMQNIISYVDLNIPGSVTPVSGVLETAILEVRKP